MRLFRVAALLVPAIVAVTITQDSMAYRGNDGSITFGAAIGKLAFTSTRDGNREVYTMNADGSAPTRLTNNVADDSTPTWSPDGTRIAVESGVYVLYVMNADGSGRVLLTDKKTSASFYRPSWSPDGSRIAFNHGGAIHTARPDGSDVVRLFESDSFYDSDPTWSPTGQQLAFVSDRDSAGGYYFDYQIYVANADGSNPRRLTYLPSPGEARFPRWSPDGSRIAFDVLGALHVIQTDGSDFTRIGLANQYHWSPDGSLIAFSSGGSIRVANADGSGVRQLTNGFSDSDPRWSPSGAKVAFARSTRFGDPRDIYVMNADGSGQIDLTNHPADDIFPDWRPMPKPKKIVLFVDGIGSTGSCSDIGPWKSIGDSLESKGLLDDWLRYVYTSKSEAVPHCWDANQSGRSWEKKDSCWSLDNKWRDIFFEHNVQGGGEADRLKTFVKAYLDSHSGVDLYIVAHSQGGLISADAVKALNDKRIKSLVTLDSPLQGINSLAGGLIVNTILRFKWGCPFPVDQFDSIDDMVCARFILCADFVKSLKSANPKTRLFTVNERGDGPGVPFEVINDEHSRLPWEQAHIEVTTGDHNTVMNGGGNQDAQGVVRAFIACAIRGTTDPRMCDEDAEGMLSEIFPNGPPATNQYVVGNGASAFQASTEWSVDAGPQQVAATGEPIIVTTLVSPSMRVIDASTVAPDVEHETGPSYESFVVTDPEPGDWTVRLSGVDLPPDGAMVRSFATEVPGSGVDADGDAVRDETDVCPAVYDTSQSDFDGDGTGDACDPDNDNDGILNESDNCEFGPNPDQLDANGNSVGDACDPDLRDLDNDGVLDGADNCFFIPNPTQADTDNDGIGDACVLVIGDTDCDQDVDAVDALNVLRDVAGLPVSAPCLASSGDIDCDSDRNAVDALGILRYVAALPVDQPQGCGAIGSPIVPAQASTGAGVADAWIALLAAMPAFGVLGARPRRVVNRSTIDRNRWR